MGVPSILLNALQPKETVDVEEDVLDQLELLNNGERNTVANTIRNMLESFRDVVINGNDDIPPLDPLRVAHLGPYVYTYTGYVFFLYKLIFPFNMLMHPLPFLRTLYYFKG